MSTFCILKYFIVLNHILGKNTFSNDCFRFYAVSAICQLHVCNGGAIVNFYNVDIDVCFCVVFVQLGNFSLKC